MDAVCHADVPLGIVTWPSGGLVFTLIVKLTYDVWSHTSVVSATREPLTLERTSPRGAVMYPSDFAPYKTACDVALVGDDATRSDGQGMLSVGALEKPIAPGASLGAHPLPGAHGNPYDPALGARWARSGFDFRAFQSASEDQRIPFPMFPLPIAYVRGGERIVTSLSPTGAQAMLLDESGRLPPSEIALRADLVGLEPSRGRCHVLLRGVYVSRGAVPEAPLVVVASGGVLATLPLSHVRAWPRRKLVLPIDVAIPEASVAANDELWGDRTVPIARGAHASHDEQASDSQRSHHAPPPSSRTEERTDVWRRRDAFAPDDELPAALGRSPHSPELNRARPAFSEEPTITAILPRNSREDTNLFDAPPETDRPRGVLAEPRDEALGMTAGMGPRAFDRALAVVAEAVTKGRDPNVFELEQRRLARALGPTYATKLALLQVAISVPALREAVDSATWGEL